MAGAAHQGMVAMQMRNQPPEPEPLAPMTGPIVVNVWGLPKEMTMDAGSWAQRNTGRCWEVGFDAQTDRPQILHGQHAQPLREVMKLLSTPA